MTKAETDISESKTVTNLGNSHQGRHRAAVVTKAETDRRDSKARTNLGNSPGQARGRRHDQGRDRHQQLKGWDQPRRLSPADVDNPGYFPPILGLFGAIWDYLRLNPGYLPPIYRHIVMDCRCPLTRTGTGPAA